MGNSNKIKGIFSHGLGANTVTQATKSAECIPFLVHA